MLTFSAVRIRDSHNRPLLQIPQLQLGKGEVLAITGPSGAGKSLYLQALFGWVDARLSGASLSPLQGAALMVQDPAHGLTPGLSIGHHFREMAGKDWRSRAASLSTSLGLDFAAFANRMPNTCSGGECQRIMLALVLLRNPSMLVCDEPVASLDPEHEHQLLTLLVDQCRLRGMSLIFVSHRFDLIDRFADRVLVIEDGQATFEGAKERLFSQPASVFQGKAVALYRRLQALSQQSPTGPVASPGTHSCLVIDRLTLARGSTQVLHDFSWHLDSASWWWLAGPSGSGKTSLMRALAGLTPWQQGTVTFLGNPLEPRLLLRSANHRTRIQYVFQHGRSALNPAVPLDRQLRRAWQAEPASLTRLAEQLHLDARAWDRMPNQFSLGELQRLNLLKVLSVRPDLLFCDELLAPLDWVLREILIDFLEAYRQSRQAAIVVCAHDPWTRAMRPGPTRWLQEVNRSK